jgi:hypothetical protein
MFNMIPHPGQQFNSLASVAAIERVIENKDILVRLQGLDGFLNDS